MLRACISVAFVLSTLLIAAEAGIRPCDDVCKGTFPYGCKDNVGKPSYCDRSGSGWCRYSNTLSSDGWCCFNNCEGTEEKTTEIAPVTGTCDSLVIEEDRLMLEDCGWIGVSSHTCEQKGCCWVPQGRKSKEPWCFRNKASEQNGATCQKQSDDYHAAKLVDCGYYGIKEDECLSRGCCWTTREENSAAPWCFYRGEDKGRSEAEKEAIADQLKKEEEAKRKAEEDAKRAAEEARKAAEEAEARRQAAEEEARRKAAEEEAAKRAADEAARKAAEEDARRKAEEEAARKAAEEEAARKAAEEEAARKAAEEAARKADEEEAARKAAEEAEEAARKAADEEAARKAAEEAARRRAAEEAARKAAEEARKAAEEAARRQAEEEERRRAAEEAARKAAEEAARAAEEAARKAADEAAKRQAAEEAARKAAEDARKEAEEARQKAKALEEEAAKPKRDATTCWSEYKTCAMNVARSGGVSTRSCMIAKRQCMSEVGAGAADLADLLSA